MSRIRKNTIRSRQTDKKDKKEKTSKKNEKYILFYSRMFVFYKNYLVRLTLSVIKDE